MTPRSHTHTHTTTIHTHTLSLPPNSRLTPPTPTHHAGKQSYYDPDGRFHPAPAGEAVTPGKMALGNLGLELVAYIHDPATDTHAILARGALRLLVLAWGPCGAY